MYRRNIKLLCVFTLGVFFLLGLISISAQTGGKSNRFNLLQPEAAGNLDQCANGGVGDVPVQCTGGAWQNGNLNHNQAHYLEGQSIPYRIIFSGMVIGSTNTVTIEWDTTEGSGGNHALDYLTSFDRTETTADPCSGVPGCNLGVFSTAAIPLDPRVAAGQDGIPGNADDITQTPGVFTLFGGSITNVSAYGFTGDFNGTSQTSITITFTADVANPVLAWGGHISTRVDWGANHSAIAFSGSPYHMRILDINGSGGNQDRSLSASAVIFPGKLTIIKDARPNTSQVFNFTALGPGVSDFTLVDDGTVGSNVRLFSSLVDFGAANGITITEAAPTGNYFLTQILCVEDPMGGSGNQNSTVHIPTRTANIILEEGESVTCTFVNAVPTAAAAALSGRVFDAYGGVRDVSVSLTNLTTGAARSTRTNTFGYYRFTDLSVGESYVITVSSKRYTFAVDTRIVTLMEDLTDQDFTATPR
jgi:hypothetical protein